MTHPKVTDMSDARVQDRAGFTSELHAVGVPGATLNRALRDTQVQEEVVQRRTLLAKESKAQPVSQPGEICRIVQDPLWPWSGPRGNVHGHPVARRVLPKLETPGSCAPGQEWKWLPRPSQTNHSLCTWPKQQRTAWWAGQRNV